MAADPDTPSQVRSRSRTPGSPLPDSTRSFRALPWLLGLVGAVLWGVAHRVVHGPRGWPMEVPGEWDLLLTSLAVAAGGARRHGGSVGSFRSVSIQ